MTTDAETTHDDDLATIAKLVKSAKIALLTTVSKGGALHSRPLAVQEADFDGDLWFFTQDPSEKTEDIRFNPQVNASLQSSKGFLSIAGRAEILRDPAKVAELWSPSIEAWFPEGRDDPSIAIIRVHADSAEYWASDEPGVVSVFKIAKAALTGGQPDVGENREVEL
jgi:general stress protein 26